MNRTQDEQYMGAAIALASQAVGQCWPNPSVGCLIVQQSQYGSIVIGAAHTSKGGRPHAETLALLQAGQRAKGATAYVTLEPCAHFGKTPPCAQSLIDAGIKRVVSALKDPDARVSGKGHQMLRNAGIEVVEDVCALDAQILNIGHIYRVIKKRPYITLKIAQSADGMVAGVAGQPIAITNRETNIYMHVLRSRMDAILVGQKTVLHDNPKLNVRLAGLEDNSPLRIVLDKDGSLEATSHVFVATAEQPTWRILAEIIPAVVHIEGVEDILCPSQKNGSLCLENLFEILAKRGITRVLVEGGPQLSLALLSQNLVDEFVIAQSSKKSGAGIQGIDLDVLGQLLSENKLQLCEQFGIQDDVISIYQRNLI